MTLRYPDPGLARLNYAATFASWNNPTPLPSAEAFAEMERVRRWAMRSKTAQEIIRKVETAPKQINVVCFRGEGETVFSSDDPVAILEGTIFFDTEARFQTKQGDTTAPLHQYIALLHEMGHAVQWMENPLFFNGNALHGKSGENAIANAAKTFWGKKAPTGSNFGQRNAFAARVLSTGSNRLARPAWSVRIEMDNLMRHEWPICDEARYPRRLGYTDLIMSSAAENTDTMV